MGDKVKYVIVDGLNSMYAAYYAQSKMSYEGKPTSIIYGLPMMIHSFWQKFGAHKVYVVWDGKKSPYRLSLLPDYKKRDKKMDEHQLKNFYEQKAVAQEILDCLGIRQYHNIACEADDMIFELSKRLLKNRSSNRITLISNDKDFHQIIGKKLKIYSSVKSNFITTSNCNSIFGYSPSNCVDYLCLIGDSSDNIPGIPGVGPATATKILNRYKTSKISLAGAVLEIMPKADPALVKATLNLNRKLIDLNKFNESQFKPEQLTRLNNSPELNTGRLSKICNKYGLRTFTKPEFLSRYE